MSIELLESSALSNSPSSRVRCADCNCELSADEVQWLENKCCNCAAIECWQLQELRIAAGAGHGVTHVGPWRRRLARALRRVRKVAS